MHAARARELPLLVQPPLRAISREQYTAVQEKASEAQSEQESARLHDTYGRLGFYPRGFDLGKAGGLAADYVGAFYSTESKEITVVGQPAHSLIVHEMVHALQDQHFDLTRLYAKHTSSDESLALSALIEGDARMVEWRDAAFDQGIDPTASCMPYATPEQARASAIATLLSVQRANRPVYLVAYAAFAYTFGAAFVAEQLKLPSNRWDYAGVNARFAEGSGPASTQEIMHPGVAPDPIVLTGLSALPADMTAEWAVESVDRMGEWYTYLLLYPSTGDRDVLARFTAAWDGDQLLALRRKDGTSSGIVWTTVWDDAASATLFAAELKHLHETLNDGDPTLIERRDNEVCFVKNMPPELSAQLARTALYGPNERRLDVLRSAVSKAGHLH